MVPSGRPEAARPQSGQRPRRYLSAAPPRAAAGGGRGAPSWAGRAGARSRAPGPESGLGESARQRAALLAGPDNKAAGSSDHVTRAHTLPRPRPAAAATPPSRPPRPPPAPAATAPPGFLPGRGCPTLYPATRPRSSFRCKQAPLKRKKLEIHDLCAELFLPAHPNQWLAMLGAALWRDSCGQELAGQTTTSKELDPANKQCVRSERILPPAVPGDDFSHTQHLDCSRWRP
ncbi:translation initiation factor IF-2-like [Cervus elaphus]|uniref:translation initiation factor IF-2-like n=1 Tax=Cervus elaphus TaxID=9860 RepID=UPI001CC31944|nr:translation initiation factor IF-2-like [Cervus elaphus]